MKPFPPFIIRVSLAVAALGCALSLSSTLYAEQIRIPIGQQAATQDAVKTPSKGMSKARVQALFGEPLETTPAKGQPPISSWKYAEFVVYFEYDHVIHSVRVFKPQQEQEQVIRLDDE